MSMDTYIKGFSGAGEKFQRMRQIYSLCKEEGIPTPQVVLEYLRNAPLEFGMGQEVDINKAVFAWMNEDMCANGYGVVLEKLPPETKIIIFYNSW